MPLPPKRRTARSIREARGNTLTASLAAKPLSSPIAQAPLYLLEGMPLPPTMHPYLRQIIQTPESALLHLSTLEQAAFDQTLNPVERFHLLSAVMCVNRAIGEAKKELKAAQALYQITKTPDTLLYKACALRTHARNEEALELIKQAEKMLVAGFPATKTAGDIANVKHFLLLQLGRWAEAYATNKKFGLHAYALADGGGTPIQRPWRGQPTEEAVGIALECAYGDFFFFGRLLPLIQRIAPRAFLYVPAALEIFTHVESFLLQQGLDVRRQCNPDTLMTTAAFLSEILNLTPDGDWSNEIPPFRADPALVEKFNYLRPSDDRPSVGLCWKAKGTTPGIVGKEISFDFYRSLSEEQADRVVNQTPNIRWVNLQYETVREGIENPGIANWQDTAAVIENLDGVVSVDTGVMNLASSMGKQTYVLLGGLVDQKFGNRNDKCPYYATSKLYRNGGFGYDRAVKAVIRDLKRFVKP